MAEGRGFFEEMKRRHVWRIAIAYAIAAWLIVQIATQVFPFFNIPSWVVRVVVLLLVLGFPFAAGFAWIYELTPGGGLRRTAPADSPQARSEPAHRSIGQRLNTIIIVVLVLAVGVTGWRLYTVRHARAAAPGAVAATSAKIIAARSIAVLPFENLSTDKGNAYFADGIQDLILTKLADINDLKVIARTSTAMYKSHPANITEIGKQLGVATILEGSVQKAGNQVLINVQLIDVATDSHIWAKAYTRTLTNVFGVEGEVAEQIATSLDAKLSPSQSKDLAAVPTKNRAAYDAFLRAEYQSNQGHTNYQAGGVRSFKTAIPLYRQAVKADPDFALAWARLSYNESELAWFDGAEDVKQLTQQARADAKQALKLAPRLAAAQLALGYTEYWGRGDYPAALKAFAAVLKLKPNDADALAAQGYVQRRMGHFEAAIASLKQALMLDPRNSVLAYELGTTYMMVSRYPEARQALQRALALDPHNLNAQFFYPFSILYAKGDIPKALAAAQGDSLVLKSDREVLLADQRKYAEALALLDSIPDTPDNFPPGQGVSKTQDLADLYVLMGDKAKAHALYAEDLPKAQAEVKLARQARSGYLAEMVERVADDELELGHTAQGLADVAKAQALIDRSSESATDLNPENTEWNASLYAKARRPDLAVPLLAKALAMPGIGSEYAPVLLWLDPAWDPIRHNARFQALEKKYAKYKPAVTYPVPAASTIRTPLPSGEGQG